MTTGSGQIYEAVMGVLGILIAPLWLYLIWLSVRTGVTSGWPQGPRRDRKPALFWLCLLAYLGLAIGFAGYGFSRL